MIRVRPLRLLLLLALVLVVGTLTYAFTAAIVVPPTNAGVTLVQMPKLGTPPPCTTDDAAPSEEADTDSAHEEDDACDDGDQPATPTSTQTSHPEASPWFDASPRWPFAAGTPTS